MESAFGIEHGDIAKARRRQQPRRVSPAAVKVAEGAKKAAQIPGKVANARVSVADAGRAAGKGAEGVGRLLNKKPGLTGAAVLGGGGYALYRNGRKGQLKPKKS